MAEFLFIYRGGQKQESAMSPEDMQEYMNQWLGWIGKAMEAGWMLTAGDALLPEGKVVHPNAVITDGPFAESKELVGGYSIIEADDLDAASKLADGCPGLLHGGLVEVRQLAKVAVESN